MNENIDLTKILKDCPKGFELYSTIHGPVTFIKLNLEKYNKFQINVHVVKNKTNEETEDSEDSFTKEGKYFTRYVNAECCLFPSKDQRDWNKFSAPWYKNSKFNADCKFKDGDIIQLGIVTAIFKKYIGEEKCICYCSFCEDAGFEIPIENGEDNVYGCYNAIPATKEQRDLLFQKMKEACYEWDVDKKELKLVKHKFKVGDWIITPTNNVLQITSIGNTTYGFNNKSHYWTICYCDEQCRFWSIKDAKDGDILAFDNDTIVIFKDLYNSESFHSYCYIEDGIFGFSEDWSPDWWNGEGFKPATKEQRDTLMKAINDAGYEWDVEKKELKNKKQK